MEQIIVFAHLHPLNKPKILNSFTIIIIFFKVFQICGTQIPAGAESGRLMGGVTEYDSKQ